ncbi:MAG: radical SAM protein, partial [Magnetococcales bacterium]|nr:radical SAM protein [Magnetococcales bacterium]
KLKWLEPVRLACDHKGQIESVRKAVELLRWHNTTPARYFCYVLVKDVDNALERVRFLKSMYVDPFAQPYIDQDGTPPTKAQRDFCRWVNHKGEFKSRTWEDYKRAA